VPSRAMIEEFLSHKNLVLVRPSPDRPVQGAKIDEELAKKGYEVSVVYLDEATPQPRLSTLTGTPEGAIVAVPRDQCAKAVREAVEAGIPRLWLQSGCESPEAIALAQQAGLPTVHGACVLMYAEPVQSVHAFHRWLWKVFGLLAK
jgi:predicted CoA-binding protein